MADRETYFISQQGFADFIKEISPDFTAFYLKEKTTQYDWKKGQRRLLFWQEYKGDLEGLIIDQVRAQDPLKQFIFPSKEKVSQDFKGLENRQDRPLLLIGAKNCDLTGLDISDFVFLEGDFKDPFYINKRESLFIIASDCSCPLDTCFCLALGIKPYPEKNYDLGISDIDGGYIVEVNSDKAQKCMAKHKDKFGPAATAQLKIRNTLRNEVINDLEINIIKYQIPRKEKLGGIMDKGFESEAWKEEVKTCVECGCCNVICPTCHCFFLNDTKKGKQDSLRYKIWDACLYKDFAVVAGAANPRKKLFQRLRNRYDKKFAFFPNVLGKIACTGCGRCITGCPGKIDIRRILKNLAAEKANA